MLSDVFLNDYFDNILDQHGLNEVLINWLIREGHFDGPINSIEDADVTNLRLLTSSDTFKPDGLALQANYTVDINYFYVNRDGQDRLLSTRFDLKGAFTFSQTKVVADGGDLSITYTLTEASPAMEVELLHCKPSGS